MSERLVSLARDAMTVGGAALVTYGAWLVYQPAGYVVAGVLLLAAGVTGVLRSP